ncbi:MAG TPA: amino acid permease [Allosphingosinicella sp.]|nr:amino acid permease [Allosphingosinicella sp.]
MATSLVVGNMIGSGAFLLPATLAPLGWNSVAGWVLTIAGALCVAGVFSWLVRSIRGEGAPYAYTEAAFGPLAAFLVTWSYWISLWIGNAAIAVASISYLSVLVPEQAALPGAGPAATCVLVWLLTLVNLAGVRAAGSVQLVTTVLKLVPLALVILLGGFALASGDAHLRPLEPNALSGASVTAAATLTLWALLGLESAAVPEGKIKDPERTIPFATMWGTAVTGLIYLVTSSAIVLLMPVEVISASGAPFSDFVERFWAPGPALLIALFAGISCIGALNGWILVQAELPYSMARHGAFPKWFAAESATGTPARALIVSSLLMTIVVLLNYAKSMTEVFSFLLLLATATTLFMYLACSLAALKLAGRSALSRSRALPWIAGVAAVYALWTIYGAGGEAVAWGVGLLIAGIPVYGFMSLARGRQSSQSG